MNKFNDPLIDNLAQKFRPIKPNTRKRDIFEDLIDSITSQSSFQSRQQLLFMAESKTDVAL